MSKQILPAIAIKTYMGNSEENLHVDIGACRVTFSGAGLLSRTLANPSCSTFPEGTSFPFGKTSTDPSFFTTRNFFSKTCCYSFSAMWFILGKCDVPLGMEDRRVPDQLITASSFYNYYCAPRNARLHQRRVGRLGGAWCAKRSDRRQWLKIDFGGLTRVSRIATQGRQNADQWVTSYYVSYSIKGYRFVTYKEYGRTKVSNKYNVC